jgi:two-component system, OmpR family, alkaline phosphatase synthesis response regulator PhoP
MTRRKVLIVEDEAALAMSLKDRLESEGYEAVVAATGGEGCERARREGFELLILDVMLPGMSGLEVCRDLRRQGVGVPILMLTARGELLDRVLGLKLGADDYLVKPFEALELMARVEALLRRAVPDTELGVFTFGPVRVDFRRMEVFKDAKRVELSALEFRLLQYLIEHRGEALPRDRLLDEVWGYGDQVYSRTVDQHVANLRRKLEASPRRPAYILTVHGVGYKLAV